MVTINRKIVALMLFSAALFIGLGCAKGNLEEEHPIEIKSEAFLLNGSPVARGDECCTDVGQMNQCWFADAAQDKVTCQVGGNNSECDVGEVCVDVGSGEGLCSCDDLDDGSCGGGLGKCSDKTVSGHRICGPSWCNGYKVCSCWGGCVDADIGNYSTPEQMCADTAAGYPGGCCDGPYAGDVDGSGFCSADPSCGSGCQSNADCNDSNACTQDLCNVDTGVCSNPTTPGVPCDNGIDEGECFGQDVCNTSAQCVQNPEPPGTGCTGTHLSSENCWDQATCNGAGVCLDRPSVLGTSCNGNHSSSENCWDQATCDGAGVCNDQPSSVGTICNGNHLPSEDCWEQATCDGSGGCVDNPAAENTPCTGVHLASEDCWEQAACNSSGTCIDEPSPVDTPCGTDHPDDPCLVQDTCSGTGICNSNPTSATSQTACTYDQSVFLPSAYPPICHTGYCGKVTIDYDNLQNSFGTESTGVCEPAVVIADNDLCTDVFNGTALETTNQGYLGTFNNTSAVQSLSRSGSTRCANDDYNAGGDDCSEAVDNLGSGAADLVYAFEYDTNFDGQNQLYGFEVKVEANFDVAVYVAQDIDSATDCITGTVPTNRCFYPYFDGISGPAVIEAQVNTAGNAKYAQQCDTSTGYKWCSRTHAGGTWEYPEDHVPCEDDNTGVTTCETTTGYSTANMAASVIFQAGDASASTKKVLIFVDGVNGAKGEFTLTVERKAWHNSPCERINDDTRVYDITSVEPSGVSVYQGNLETTVNSDHSKVSDTCGGFDCTATWFGTTAIHGTGTANAFWPNGAYFKIHRQTGQGDASYCVSVDETIANSANTVLESSVRTNAADYTICDATYTGSTAVKGSDGLQIDAKEGELWLLKLSELNARTAPCPVGGDCNYKLVVKEGECPTDPTPDIGSCTTDPEILTGCTAHLGTLSGQITIEDGSASPLVQYGQLDGACGDDYPSKEASGIEGFDAAWIIHNYSATAKDLTILIYGPRLDAVVTDPIYSALGIGEFGGRFNIYANLWHCDDNPNTVAPREGLQGTPAWIYDATEIGYETVWFKFTYTIPPSSSPAYEGPYFLIVDSWAPNGFTNWATAEGPSGDYLIEVSW